MSLRDRMRLWLRLRRLGDYDLLERRFVLRQRNSPVGFRTASLKDHPGLSDSESKELRAVEKECKRRGDGILQFNMQVLAEKYGIRLYGR